MSPAPDRRAVLKSGAVIAGLCSVAPLRWRKGRRTGSKG